MATAVKNFVSVITLSFLSVLPLILNIRTYFKNVNTF